MSDGAAWRIVVTPRAEKELRSLSPPDKQRIKRGIDALVSFPKRGDLRKLKGSEDEWRLRVGTWRVRFQVDPQEGIIVILRVLRRSQAYRRDVG